MTPEQFGEAVVKDRVLDRTLGYVIKQFRRIERQDVEDVVYMTFFRAARHPEKFSSGMDIQAYMYESAKFNMIEHLKRAKERRQALKSLPYTRRSHRDPSLPLDYRVDLERAIRKSERVHSARQALWLHVFEGYDLDDISPALPSERAKRTWENHLRDSMRKLRLEMRRKGYRRFK